MKICEFTRKICQLGKHPKDPHKMWHYQCSVLGVCPARLKGDRLQKRK